MTFQSTWVIVVGIVPVTKLHTSDDFNFKETWLLLFGVSEVFQSLQWFGLLRVVYSRCDFTEFG